MEPIAWYRIAVPLVVAAGIAVMAAVGRNPRLRFATLGLMALAGYGMVQDQVSARLCPEYFTVFHPPVPGLTDPTLLGIAWGFLWACGGGLILGYVAGVVATAGTQPPLAPRDALRPFLTLLVVVGLMTALAGYSVHRHAEMFGVTLDPELAAGCPPERQRALLIVACAHFVTYATSAVGGVAVCVWLGIERGRRADRLR